MLKNRKGSKKQQPKKQDRISYKIDSNGNFSEVKESNKSMFDAKRVGGSKDGKTQRGYKGYKPRP